MDTLFFLGRFHVLMLHLPIGIILVTIVLECLAWSHRWRHLNVAGPYLWGLASIVVVVTACLGFLHGQEGGFDPTLLEAHLFWGVALAISTLFTWLLRTRTAKWYRTVQPALAVILLIVITMTGHYGGNLTHGSTFLVQYAPPPIQQLAGYNASLAAGEDSQDRSDGGADGSGRVGGLPENFSATARALLDAGFNVRPVDQQDARLVIGTASAGRALSANELQVLAAAAGEVVELNLQDTGLNDASIAFILDFSNLETLRLSNNDVSDASVAQLVNLPKLRTLNLYGNARVSDAAIDSILSMPNLSTIYVWNTAVTDAGIARLRQEKPQLAVQSASSFLLENRE